MMVHKHAAGKYPKQPKQPPGPVAVTRVDPEILVIAWRLAEGNGARLEVISHDKIKIHNHPWR